VIYLTQQGALTWLNVLTDSATFIIHLYVNDIDLSDTTVQGDFVEASFGGYAPQPVARWFNPAWNVDRGVIFGDTLAWTFSGIGPGQTVFGAYATLGDPGPLAWAEACPFGPIVVATAGQILAFTPRLTVRTDPNQT
jgi:hypothetical protein